MKSLILSLLSIVISVSAFAESSDVGSITWCKAEVETAQSNVTKVLDYFYVGEVSKSRVLQAKLEALNQRFECRMILFSDYCKDAPTLSNEYLQAVKSEAANLILDQDDILEAEKQITFIQNRCR